MPKRVRCPYCRSLLDPEELGAQRTCPTCRIAFTEPPTVEGSWLAALLGALGMAFVCVFGELILLNVGAFVCGLFSRDPYWHVAQGGESCACMSSLLLAPVAAVGGALVGAWRGWRWSLGRTKTVGRPAKETPSEPRP